MRDALVDGDWAYHFRCAVCDDGRERFGRISKTWDQIVHIALWNCTTRQGRASCHLQDDLCAFIERHWTSLCGRPPTPRARWCPSVRSKLSKGNGDKYISFAASNSRSASSLWGLVDNSDPSVAMDGCAQRVGPRRRRRSRADVCARRRPYGLKHEIDPTKQLSSSGKKGDASGTPRFPSSLRARKRLWRRTAAQTRAHQLPVTNAALAAAQLHHRIESTTTRTSTTTIATTVDSASAASATTSKRRRQFRTRAVES